MNTIINLISISSIFTASILGLLAVIKDTKNRNGSLNKWGKFTIIGIIISSLFSLVKEEITENKDENAAQLELKRRDTTIIFQKNVIQKVNNIADSEISNLKKSRHIDTSINKNLFLSHKTVFQELKISKNLERLSRPLLPIDEIQIVIAIPSSAFNKYFNESLKREIANVIENKNNLFERASFTGDTITFFAWSPFMANVVKRINYSPVTYFDQYFYIAINENDHLSSTRSLEFSATYRYHTEIMGKPDFEVFYNMKDSIYTFKYNLQTSITRNTLVAIRSINDLQNKKIDFYGFNPATTLKEVSLICGPQKEFFHLTAPFYRNKGIPNKRRSNFDYTHMFSFKETH